MLKGCIIYYYIMVGAVGIDMPNCMHMLFLN